jgi:hypothetical protein
VLADGTAFYAPLGEVVVVDDALVTCHLCGRLLRSVTAHLRAHGWTKQVYCDYLGRRRAAGWTWQEIAAESGQPSSWLRRQAAACGLTSPAV